MINDFFTSNKDKVNAIKANKANINKEKVNEDCNFRLQFDGCSKSNPGLAGAGSVIYNVKNDEVWKGSEINGTNVTNNHAE